jgi:hypothetical protein
VETKILKLETQAGIVHYNPGLARDPKGNVFISIRSCETNTELFKNKQHPNHYQNFLHVGLLDELAMEVMDLKLVEPEADYEGFQWGIEDVRLFWREDGLHGIGVIIPIEGGEYKLRLAEILIDYDAGTYKLLKDHGRPFGHAEKNWSPSEVANPHFDFVYSPTQVVKDGKVYGVDNDLFIHNGTPLIHYQDGYLSIGHAVVAINGERTYAQIALKFDEFGILVAHSQFFHFNLGWREKLRETIEFASGLLWSDGKEGEELLIGLGVKDEIAALCKLSIDKLKWDPYSDTTWYAWRWQGQPNRSEIRNEPTQGR